MIKNSATTKTTGSIYSTMPTMPNIKLFTTFPKLPARLKLLKISIIAAAITTSRKISSCIAVSLLLLRVFFPPLRLFVCDFLVEAGFEDVFFLPLFPAPDEAIINSSLNLYYIIMGIIRLITVRLIIL